MKWQGIVVECGKCNDGQSEKNGDSTSPPHWKICMSSCKKSEEVLKNFVLNACSLFDG
jgi:hypothetical protein